MTKQRRGFLEQKSGSWARYPSADVFVLICLQMAGQVHCVVQQTKHIDQKRFAVATNTIEHEVSTLSPTSGDVKRHQSLSNVIALPCSGDVRPRRERLDGFVQGVGVGVRLCFTESLGGSIAECPGNRFRRMSSV